MKQNDTNKKTIVMIILVVIILIIFAIITYTLIRDQQKINENRENSKNRENEEYKGYGNELDRSQINVDIDPVDNIKNVIKQSILLEEHLIEKNNQCHECIFTHFLHSIALLEEAMKIAHKNVKQYPRLEETYKLYKELFEEWSKNKQNYESLQNISEKVREMRKKLMEQYYIL